MLSWPSEKVISGIIYSLLKVMQNIFLTIFSTKFVVKCATKNLKIDWQIKKLCPKTFLNRKFSIENWQGREVITFPENFKNLNNLSWFLEISIRCHRILTRDQNFWFKSMMLSELKVYDHGLSPLPMQNPYSKLIPVIKSLFVNCFSKFLLHTLLQI